MAASALCVRPADCLGGNPIFGAHRGVRAAPAPPRRPAPQKQQQQHVQVATTASTSAPGQSRPARGRANGRQRGRRSPRGAGSPAEKRVMENVVILKRGEQTQSKVAAAPELVLPQAAAKSGAQAEKAEPAAAANQRGVQAEKAELVAAAEDKHITHEVKAGTAADQHSTAAAKAEKAEPVAAAEDTRAKKAAEQPRGADATTNAAKAKAVAPSDQHVPQAKGKDVNKNVAAAKQSGGQGMKAGALYSGPSFAAAPEPRELPIPFLLLKGRGARLRPRDAAEHAAPTAPAA